MEITYLSKRQIQWAKKLSHYHFEMDYCSESKNLAKVLSPPFTSKNIKKELVEKN